MWRMLLTIAVLVLIPATCFAEDMKFEFAGDQFASGQRPTLQQPVERDAFIAGNDVSLTAPVAGSAHLVGMNVNAAAPVTGNLYAAGFTVNVTAPVTGNLTAAGNTVAIASSARVGGNARLAGSSVTLAAPVSDSALVTAQSLTLEGTIGHDLAFHGQNLTFGPGAKVNGTLSIEAPKPIEVPASVAPAERVKYQQAAGSNYFSQAGSTAGGVLSGFWPAFWAIGTWWLLLFVIGAAFIAFAPRLMGALDDAATFRPGQKLLFGLLALATLLGLVPVLVLTVVGLLLMPVLLLLIFVACTLGYIAGAFFLALRIAERTAPIDNAPRRIAVLAVALIVAGLVSTVPVLGWVFSFVLLLFGLGLMTTLLTDRWNERRVLPRMPSPASAPHPTAR